MPIVMTPVTAAARGIIVMALAAGVWAKGPLHRMQQQQAAAGGSAADVGPGPSVAFLQSVIRDGHVDPLDVLNMGLKAPGYQKLLANTEIQHRLLEELPLLRAFKPFRDIFEEKQQGSTEQTATSFATGMQQVFSFMKEATTKIKDPNAMVDSLSKIAASSDPATQDIFKRARAGEEAAVLDLQKLVAKDQFPGIDMDVLREVGSSQTFNKLLGMEEIMTLIDRVPLASELFRNPASLKPPASFT